MSHPDPLEALTSLADHTAYLERDTANGTTDLAAPELAEGIAHIQDIRHRLALVERDLTTALGREMGKGTGSLADGRQFTVDRMADRKEWQHDEWKRDARRAIIASLPIPAAVDPDSGEFVDVTPLLFQAVTTAQEVHGSTAPRSRALKALGLYASDYCTSTPGGWRFTAVKPTTGEDTQTDA